MAEAIRSVFFEDGGVVDECPGQVDRVGRRCEERKQLGHTRPGLVCPRLDDETAIVGDVGGQGSGASALGDDADPRAARSAAGGEDQREVGHLLHALRADRTVAGQDRVEFGVVAAQASGVRTDGPLADSGPPGLEQQQRFVRRGGTGGQPVERGGVGEPFQVTHQDRDVVEVDEGVENLDDRDVDLVAGVGEVPHAETGRVMLL